uniref:Uncharacterized protein n=1 Tax=Avena sativa TaxID=4498 RepID=A0ACD5X9Q7_AVESA
MAAAAAAAVANGELRGGGVPRPTNPMVTPLLTDLYQFSMAYAYWKAGKHLDHAVFDLYFRKNPFAGEFTIFGGLEECIRFIANFKFKEEEIRFLRAALPTCEDGFFEYLSSIDCSEVEVYAIPEGSAVFPKVPLMIIQGPVAESVHQDILIWEDLMQQGRLRSHEEQNINVAAGRLFGIPIRGTHSHAFVSSFLGLDEIIDKALSSSDGTNRCEDFVSLVQNWLRRIQMWLGQFFYAIEKEFGVVGFGLTNITASNDLNEETIDALNKQGHEVDSFGIGTYLVTCYAQAALGCVFKLVEINKQPRIKLSEDVTKVSIPCKKRCYRLYGKEGYPLVDIMTGQDEPSPKVNDFLNQVPRNKDENHQTTISILYVVTCNYLVVHTGIIELQYPHMTSCYRSHVRDPVDSIKFEWVSAISLATSFLIKAAGAPPPAGLVFYSGLRLQNEKDIDATLFSCEATQREDLTSISENRSRCMRDLDRMRPDHLRKLNPTPYKVSVSTQLYDFIHFLWLNEAPNNASVSSTVYNMCSCQTRRCNYTYIVLERSMRIR